MLAMFLEICMVVKDVIDPLLEEIAKSMFHLLVMLFICII